MASKRNTVSKKTFLKWSNNNGFDFEVDNNNALTLLKYKICTVNLAENQEKQENIIYVGLF